ncbi:fucolectin-5-like [Garra rufa]|uniref:fucolectin-5-like n=1 Tax=Garra rufa TaxID=137080 RepID=UPI003CCE6AB5
MEIIVMLLLSLLPGLCGAVSTEYNPTCVPGNLALGANAVQSSVFRQYYARYAVDGNRDPDASHRSCSLTEAGSPSWWRVDLKRVYKIRKVTITALRHPYNEGNADLQGSVIRIGNSLENNGNYNKLAAVIGDIPNAGTETFEFAPIFGRYVNIVGSNPYLYVCEVEVYC